MRGRVGLPRHPVGFSVNCAIQVLGIAALLLVPQVGVSLTPCLLLAGLLLRVASART